jgi:hypothetical protein
MNTAFDYNGHTVSPSKPVKQLRTLKKTLLVDSKDRNIVTYPNNGEFVVYLPRVYENVVSIRLMAAEFPLVATGTATLTYPKTIGTIGSQPNYFLVDLIGLNKTDECAVSANKSTYTDGFFAKIPCIAQSNGASSFIEYNDHSGQENIARYTPAIGKMDRLHIRTRLHSQQGNLGYIYWPSEFALSLEVEYLDNVFDDFSQFETRISTRS